ncbi:hypothetical protein LSTR_LSTR012513 [Laodelphax striatellus]|uniref:G-protein coupled receptors family 1 profile domain-containing protein n=1 Tax=Laodelphax striatellus TaxID=195883 RepID=A0A482XM99_LAOST|nr:hypothetical protein LSTR_LSTR012513 [Laodelphax striatellus]
MLQCHLKNPSFEKKLTEQFAVMWTLFILIVLGNSAVLLTLLLRKNRKSRMNFFIMQLAIADLAVGLIQVLTDIIVRMTIAWHAGNLACKVVRYLQAVVTYSSTYVLVALSIDRYDAIKHPMKFSGSWRRAKVLVAVAWFLSLLFSTPSMVLFEVQMVQGQLQCWIELTEWQWQLYMTVVALLIFVIPAIIITACYAIIVSTIWSKSSHIVVVDNVHKRNNKGLFDKSSHHHHHHHHLHDHDSRRASSRGLIPKAKVKTVKMTFVIVFVFILCWSPYIVFDLLQVYGFVPKTQTNMAVATLIQSLAPLNSSANPIIYCLFSTHFCRTLRKLPPFRWLGQCFPERSGRCLRYGTESTSTMTETLSSRRSGTTNSATSMRHHVTIRLPNETRQPVVTVV